MPAQDQLYIGLMSGTSMDGVDAVLARLDKEPGVVGHYSLPYPKDLLTSLRRAASGNALSACDWLQLDQNVGEHFALAASRLIAKQDVELNNIAAIGSHGQTIWHEPHSSSMQIGNANLIAAQTGITTVADFRRMDMAYGGQGAPLVPAFHGALFSAPSERRVILNLGGIANITVLNPGDSISGYDTGPANCLLDTHYRHCFDKAYDENGDWAASGSVQQTLLENMLSEPYFEQAAPKSTGPEHFSWGWVTHYLNQQPCEGADLQATLTALTAETVAKEIKKQQAERAIVCGGGVYNRQLMQGIQDALPNTVVETTAAHGIDPQHIEAMAFAWLAKQRLAQEPGNLPSVTGARQHCPLGAVYQP